MKAMYLSISAVLIAGSILTYSPEDLKEEKMKELNEQLDIIKKTEFKGPKDSDALVNYSYFKELVDEVEEFRAERLIDLDEFLKKSKKSNTVILDTRSKAMYDLKHIKGAIHLNFSDFTLPELNALFGKYNGQGTEILIYCNNNFYDSKATLELVAPEFVLQDMAFVSKSAMPVEITKIDEKEVMFNNKYTLALNIPTFLNLYGYGYKNIYELNELVDVHDSRIEFEGTFDDGDTN